MKTTAFSLVKKQKNKTRTVVLVRLESRGLELGRLLDDEDVVRRGRALGLVLLGDPLLLLPVAARATSGIGVTAVGEQQAPMALEERRQRDLPFAHFPDLGCQERVECRGLVRGPGEGRVRGHGFVFFRCGDRKRGREEAKKKKKEKEKKKKGSVTTASSPGWRKKTENQKLALFFSHTLSFLSYTPYLSLFLSLFFSKEKKTVSSKPGYCTNPPPLCFSLSAAASSEGKKGFFSPLFLFVVAAQPTRNAAKKNEKQNSFFLVCIFFFPPHRARLLVLRVRTKESFVVAVFDNKIQWEWGNGGKGEREGGGLEHDEEGRTRGEKKTCLFFCSFAAPSAPCFFLLSQFADVAVMLFLSLRHFQ